MNWMELAYLEVEVREPSSLGCFFTDVIGLAPGPPTGDGLATWTNDAAVHRVLVAGGEADDVVALGFEVAEADWDDALARLRGAGLPARPDERRAAARRVDRLVSVVAPWGSTVDLVCGLARDEQPPGMPHVPGGFLTDGVGLGHVVLAATEFEQSLRFATEGLGMVRTDWLETEVVEGLVLEVHFFHCNARHHTLALARAPFEVPQTLHHLMVEVNEQDDVGAAYDRAVEAQLPLPSGLGRHENDRMFGFYVAAPAGFEVEVGHGGRMVDEPWTDDRRYDRISAWGHHPVNPS